MAGPAVEPTEAITEERKVQTSLGGRRPDLLKTSAVFLLSGTLSALLLIVVWQFVPSRSFTLDLGAPGAAASHFFPVEQSGGTAFRWSKDLSAVSLPALGTSQQIAVTANPARPDGSAAPHLALMVGDRTIGEFSLQPGWHTYTATVNPGFAPDVRLVLDSETFYPSANDRRRLGAAISSFQATARVSRFGFYLPPPFYLFIAFFSWLPVGLASSFSLSRRTYVLLAVAGLMPSALAVLLPAQSALPVAGWLWGLASGGSAILFAWRTLSPNQRLARALDRLAASRWEIPALLFAVALLAVLMTWPLAARIGDSLPGWPADNFAFLYKFWWFRTALFDRHINPFFDPNTFAPFGFSLGEGEPTLINTVPGAIIGALVGDVASYNFVTLLSFVLSGLAGYLLVREITGNKGAALLAALAFAFAPYRMSQFAGHIQMLGTAWIAFAFYFAEKTFRTRRAVDGALCGLSLAGAALSAWYYGYMAGLLLGIYILLRLWFVRRAYSPAALLRPAVAGIVALLIVALPAALPSLGLLGTGGLSHSAKAADEHSAAPADYVIPNPLQPIWGQPFMTAHSDQNVIESSLYLGVVVVGIAIAGWWIGRRKQPPGLPLPDVRRGVRTAWVVVLVVSFVLSLGLYLHDTGGQVQLSGQGDGLPLPGRFLFDVLPLYSSMRAYARFGILALLALVVLMGIGWSVIAARWPGRSRQLALVAAVLLMVDFWTGPYSWGTTTITEGPTAAYLASAPPGTVIQLPLAAGVSGPALYDEVYLNKPIAYGYDTFEPPAWRDARPALAKFPADTTLDLLKSWNVRYIVVSGNAYGADWPGTLDYLKSLPRMKLLGVFQEPRAWHVDPGVLDARPDMEEYAMPDNKAVFELLR